MGCNQSSNNVGEDVKNREIDTINRADWIKEQSRIKLLLLGAGESGKSTFFKQMKILHKDTPFSKNERSSLVPNIHASILDNVQALLEYSTGKYPFTADGKHDKLAKQILGLSGDAPLDSTLASGMKKLWKSKQVQSAWMKRSEFQVTDSLEWFFGELDRIVAPNYVPTDQDILFVRIRTSGIVEETFKINNVDFSVFDVGGQRNERKKWIHCFEDVTAVLFFAALSEYDQVLYEDGSMNRMDEAVLLFDNICNNEYFQKTAMILFLNKNDLFRDKLCNAPFRVDKAGRERFVDFEGPFVDRKGPSGQLGTPEFEECYQATLKYVEKLFLARKRREDKDVFVHVTCATDTKNVNKVFQSCKEIVLQENLMAHGFMR